MVIRNWPRAKKMYHAVLVLGMVSCVVTFNIGRELLSAAIVIVSVASMSFIEKRSERPIFDERDVDIAEESTHQAVMWSGVLGGVIMIIVSIGMGLGEWSYPEWIAPYYLTWGGIVGLTMLIEATKRFRGAS